MKCEKCEFQNLKVDNICERCAFPITGTKSQKTQYNVGLIFYKNRIGNFENFKTAIMVIGVWFGGVSVLGIIFNITGVYPTMSYLVFLIIAGVYLLLYYARDKIKPYRWVLIGLAFYITHTILELTLGLDLDALGLWKQKVYYQAGGDTHDVTLVGAGSLTFKIYPWVRALLGCFFLYGLSLVSKIRKHSYYNYWLK